MLKGTDGEALAKEVSPVYSAGELALSAEGEPLLKGHTVWMIGANAGTPVVPKGSGNAPGTVQVQFADGSSVPWDPAELSVKPPPAGVGPEYAAPDPGMVKVGLVPGDSVFYWDGAYWKKDTTGETATVIDSPSGKWDPGHFATFDAGLEVVWAARPTTTRSGRRRRGTTSCRTPPP